MPVCCYHLLTNLQDYFWDQKLKSSINDFYKLNSLLKLFARKSSGVQVILA